MSKNIFLVPLLFLFLFTEAQTFRIKISSDLKQPVLDGRLLLLISSNNLKEPRFQISDAINTQMVFGKDVENWQMDMSQLVSEDAFGYPVERLNNIPEGDYYVQALLHKYETFKLKTGHTVKLPGFINYFLSKKMEILIFRFVNCYDLKRLPSYFLPF